MHHKNIKRMIRKQLKNTHLPAKGIILGRNGPEISYRKFCTEEYIGLDRKQNRVFMGLPLDKKVMFDHPQLYEFYGIL